MWIGSYKLRANIAKFTYHVMKLVERVKKVGVIHNKALVKKDLSFVEAIRSNDKIAKCKTTSDSDQNITCLHFLRGNYS